MTRLSEILQKFEDIELLQLKKFKYDTYLLASKKSIDKEIERRNISFDQFEKLENELKQQIIGDPRPRCPRCLSLKITVDQVEYWNTYNRRGIKDDLAVYDGIGGRSTSAEKLTCIVCDYVLHDPNVSGVDILSSNISNFLRKLFKKKES